MKTHDHRVILVKDMGGPSAMFVPTRRWLVVERCEGRRQTLRRIRFARRQLVRMQAQEAAS